MHIPKQIATEDTFILQKSESSGRQPSLVTGLLYLLKSVLCSHPEVWFNGVHTNISILLETLQTVHIMRWKGWKWMHC